MHSSSSPDFEYNGAGMLTKDLDKGITMIIYNNIGLVDSICFSSGASVKYVYAMTGEKLRVRHYAAPSALSSSRMTLSAGSSVLSQTSSLGYEEDEYLGADIVKHTSVSGLISSTPSYKYYFGGGYMTFSETTNVEPKFYYYTKDHLGNIRNVLTKNDSGQMEEIQRTAYPFGGIIADLSTGRDALNEDS